MNYKKMKNYITKELEKIVKDSFAKVKENPTLFENDNIKITKTSEESARVEMKIVKPIEYITMEINV